MNRNLPTSNWRAEATNPRCQPGDSPGSEVETKYFLDVVERTKPVFIISVHSFSDSLLLYPTNPVNAPFRAHVEAMSRRMGLRIVDAMNYEIFGSLSRYGFEQQIPTLTIELLRWERVKEQAEACSAAIIEFIHSIA